MSKLKPGVTVGAVDISLDIGVSIWTEWKRTFCFLPRKDITGIFIIGPIWCRMRKDRMYEYENDVGYYISANLGYIEYARTKKDIFLRSLSGERNG